MFIYISKIVPRDPQENESNFEKIDLWWISHVNGNIKIFCRNFSSQRTCAGNSTALTLTTPKIKATKILAVCGPLR